MRPLYKKIDKILRRVPVRTLQMYNNLVSGIIGGTIIYYLITLKTIQNIIRGFWYVLILWLIGLWAISHNLKEMRSKNSKKREKMNYLWNTLMALIGGFYLLAIFKLTIFNIEINFLQQILIILSITLILVVVFVLISCLRNKRPKKK